MIALLLATSNGTHPGRISCLGEHTKYVQKSSQADTMYPQKNVRVGEGFRDREGGGGILVILRGEGGLNRTSKYL